MAIHQPSAALSIGQPVSQKIKDVARSFLARTPLPAWRRALFEQPTEQIIRRMFEGRAVRFLQIGSNDGKHGDPIFALARDNPAWSGIFVEPVPSIFDRLRRNYGNDARFTFENVAVSGAHGVRSFFVVAEDRAKAAYPDLPEWYDQLGSFDRGHIVKHLDGKLEPFIVELQIACETLPTLLERNAISSLDLIHIDTEGHDWEILSQVDLAALSPDVVLYEHAHLGNDDARRAEAKLVRAGYTIRRRGNDTIGVKAARR